MATPLTTTRLLAALKAEGCRVVEVRDWRHHNRNHKGAWGPVNGVMLHHTVTSGTDASVRLCYDGRTGLPGPLCHGVIAKDGRIHMVGHGRANHAGMGDDDVLRAVIAESALPADNEANTDGNARFYGFECVNWGNGSDPWPAAQVDAMVRASAAICRAHGWGKSGPTSVIGHLEWQPGKVDPRPSPGPGDVRMPSIRARVAERLRHSAGWNPTGDTVPPITTNPPQEADMPATLHRLNKSDGQLTPGKWATLDVDGSDLFTGVTAYDVMVTVEGKGAVGGTLQGRFYHRRTDGTRWNGRITERQVTAGGTFADFQHKGAVASAERVRFEACYWPAVDTDTAPFVLSARGARGLSWKA